MKFVATKDLDALRASARLRLDAVMAMRRRAVVGDNADVHAAKLAEARASGNPFWPTPLIDAEARAIGIEADVLAQRIVQKAAAAAGIVVALEAERQAGQAAISSAATPRAIETVIQTIESKA